MPELAEVEFYRKCWDPGLGQKIGVVQLHDNKRVFRGEDTKALCCRLVRQEYLRSQVHGKQMLFEFSGDNWLGIHLGMSGKLRVEKQGFEPGKHDHLVLQQASRSLVFCDPRQFGRVRFHHGKKAPAWWPANLPEVHSRAFTRKLMSAFVKRHARAPIKAVLLLQGGFPGIGNWMADEILWRAGIAPQRRAAELREAKLILLWRNVRFVARASLESIGKNNTDPPHDWLLHERWKSRGKCPKHGTKLRRETVGGRTTAWCPRCQH
ncbi:MAG TPA: DNA-formamidopyrimidine glycosylase family protein [Chthoniobacterales bacterium]|jgi:formamidopyrimidine-DNA glycosylase